MDKSSKDMVYLTVCAVLGKVPDRELVLGMDHGAVIKSAKQHKVGAMTAFALEPLKTELGDEIWQKYQQLRDVSIRKNMLFDAERRQICDYLDSQEIWYVPLKGIVIGALYPRYGMREMCDNDILFDIKGSAKIYDFMKGRGYETPARPSDLEVRTVLDFQREPIYHFEFHNSLFPEYVGNGRFHEYYRSIGERLKAEEGSLYRRLLTDEDRYVYLFAHAFKHWEEGGIGFRTVTDVYVLRREGCDEKAAKKALKQLGIADFAADLEKLADELFEDPCNIYGKESLQGHSFLADILHSREGGTRQEKIERRLKHFSGGKRYLWWRIFPDYKMMKTLFPIVAKYPVLLPFLYVWRLIRGLFSGRMQEFRQEAKYVREKRETENGEEEGNI